MRTPLGATRPFRPRVRAMRASRPRTGATRSFRPRARAMRASRPRTGATLSSPPRPGAMRALPAAALLLGAAFLAAGVLLAGGALLPAHAALAARGATASPFPLSATRTSAGAGISLRRPPGWALLTKDITALTSPAERLLLTSYRAAAGGNCAPDVAARELPAGGALVYLFEYGARRADPRAFPPRPAHFSLDRRALADYECWRVPSYLIRFRDAGRAFQVHVALGRRAGRARRAQVLAALDSLRVSRLAAARS